MGATVNVVVTCTNRKTRLVPKGLRLRDVGGRGVRERVANWITHLESHSEPTVPARLLYSGDHWFVARDLCEEGTRAGLSVRTWICSAGYGLVPLQAEIRPYSATFTAENPDAVRRVGRGIADRSVDADWWGMLSKWKGPVPGAPRTLMELAAEHPRTPYLLILSPRYLDAVRDDLRLAREALRSPEQLSIFSAGTTEEGSLENHLIPCDARLQSVVQGARFSLSARAARLAIRNHRRWGLYSAALREAFSKLVSAQPDPIRHNRVLMTDAQVGSFIREAIKAEPSASKTRLLRKLRSENRACEQARFGAVFREVREEVGRAEA